VQKALEAIGSGPMVGIEMDEPLVSVTSLVAAKLPNGGDRIGALATRIAGMLRPPVDPNEQLTADQAAKAARWVAGHVDGAEALRVGGVLTENVLIPKEEYLALVTARDIVIRLFGRMNQAFSEDAEIPNTVENERERLALALWSIAVFFGRSGFNQPNADRFFELGSAISDLNDGIRPSLLVPTRIDSNPPQTSQFWRARVNVVLAFEALSRGVPEGRSGSESRRNIAKKIDRDAPELRKLVRPKWREDDGMTGPLDLPTTIVSDWLKKLKGASIKNGEATRLYEFGREAIRALPDERLIQFAQDQIAVAKAFCGTLSP
jgi:hypothetical protein